MFEIDVYITKVKGTNDNRKEFNVFSYIDMLFFELDSTI